MTSDDADVKTGESTKIIRFELEHAKNVDRIDIVFASGNQGQISHLGAEPYSLAEPELEFLPKTMMTKMNDIDTEVSLTMDQGGSIQGNFNIYILAIQNTFAQLGNATT